MPQTLAAAAALLALTMNAGVPTAPWPTRGWSTSTPEAQGMDAAALAALDAEFAAGKWGYIDGMLLVRNGHVVFERTYRHDYERLFTKERGAPGPYNYYDPAWHPYYKGTDLHTLQSATKSVTSALIGIAQQRGELPGVDDRLLPHFRGYRTTPDPLRERITLRHLLTMTAGIAWDETTVAYTDPRNSCARMEASDDWVQFVLDQPMAGEPGTRFVYSSGATQLLSQVLKTSTGLHADAYAARHLLAPLGIEAFHWKRTPTGHADTEGGLYLRSRDLAKIGYLYQHDGIWEGRRLLPAGWVGASTAPAVDAPWGSKTVKYGYQWWLLPRGKDAYAWGALGYGGQRMLVVPEYDLIAVFTGWNIYEQPPLDPILALERLMGAIRR